MALREPALPSGMLTTHIDPFTGENDALSSSRLDAFGTLPSGTRLGVGLNTDELIEVDPEDLAEWHRAVSRNGQCPCGSGRKFKHCHGVI